MRSVHVRVPTMTALEHHRCLTRTRRPAGDGTHAEDDDDDRGR